jgi:hypothetical protein
MSTRRQSDPGPILDHAAPSRAWRFTPPLALLATLVACHAPPTRVAAPEATPPPPAAHPVPDAAYDWRGLVIAPFGSVLKDIPVALHEVLLFRDEAHDGAAADDAADASAADAECYAADAPAPGFAGRIPDEYLLCFRQGRLSRIQASVRLTAAEAPDVFAAACTGWSKSEPAVGAPSAAVPAGPACEARDGAVRIRGRLGEEPGRTEIPQTESVLSITLDSTLTP